MKNSKKKKILQFSIAIITIVIIILLLLMFLRPKNVTVTLKLDEEVYETVRKGNKIEEPKDPEKEGYTFVGWYVNDEKFDFDKPVKEDIELTPKWKINKYTITISVDKNTSITKKIKYGNTLDEPVAPTKKGYTFLGWYVDGKKYDFNTKVTKEITLEAKWKKNSVSSDDSKPSTESTVNKVENVTYTVEHYLMNKDHKYDSNPSETEKYTTLKGNNVTPNVKTYKGYISPDKKSVEITEDGAVIKYYYEREQHNLIIATHGDGISLDGITVNGKQYSDFLKNYEIHRLYYGDTVEISAETMKGYHFTNWESSDIDTNVDLTNSTITITVGLNDIYLDAYADINKYTVEFNGNGGITPDEEETYIQEFTYADAKRLLDNKFEMYGYHLIGWSTDELAQEVEYVDKALVNSLTDENNGIVKLYAVWEIDKNTVMFYANGGYFAGENNKNVYIVTGQEYESTITKPKAPVRDGYTFTNKWYKDADCKNEWDFENDLMPDYGLSLYAEWVANTNTKYNVEFYVMNTDGTYNNTATITVEKEGTTDTKPSYVPTVLDYQSAIDNVKGFGTPVLFDGDENVTINGNMSSKSVIRYYIPRNQYNLTVQGDSKIDPNSLTGNGTYYYGATIDVSAAPVKGYHISNWEKTLEDSSEVGSDVVGGKYVMPASNVTLTAKTEANKYTVTFHGQGGTVEGNKDSYTQELTYDLTYTLDANKFTRDHYDFVGWSTSDDDEAEYVVTDGTYTLNDNLAESGNVDLYAVWKIHNYSVSYKLNSDETMGEKVESYTYLDTLDSDLSINNPTKEGFTFNGWIDQDMKNIGKNIPKGTARDLTLTADWIEHTYTIIYKDGNTEHEHEYRYTENVTLESNSLFTKKYQVKYKYNDGKTPDENKEFSSTYDKWLNGETSYNVGATVSKLASATVDGEEIILTPNWKSPTLELDENISREDFVFDGWYNGDVKVTNSTVVDENLKEISAVWYEIPYVESFTLGVKDGNGDDYKEAFAIGRKSFYIKLPRNGTINPNVLSLSTTVPIKLNPNAVSNSSYTDVVSDSNGKITLSIYTIKISSSDNKTWVSNGGGKYESTDIFLRALSKEKPLGIAKDFGLNGIAGMPHYVSRQITSNGATYLYFSPEETQNVTVQFYNGATNKLVPGLSFSIPKGAPAPKIGEFLVGGYDFNGWYTDSSYGEEYDFSKPVENNIIIYGNYTENTNSKEWHDNPIEPGKYKICTYNDLLGLSTLVAEGNSFAGETVYVSCDIKLNEDENWVPISGFKGNLNGEFDGKNYHTISNLTINAESVNAGLFSTLSTGSVKNLKFENVNIYSSSSNVGTIAGSIFGDTLIENVSVENVSINGSTQVGGIAGDLYGTAKILNSQVIKGSWDDKRIETATTDVGGIVGFVHGSNTIDNVYSDVTIYAPGGSVSILKHAAHDAGGIIGDYVLGTYSLSMSHVIFNGDIQVVNGSFESYGPVFGRMGSTGYGLTTIATATKYEDDGTLTEPMKTWLYRKSDLSIKKNLSRGTGKTLDELKSVDTYDGWSTKVWNITEGNLPTLNWLES